MQLFGFGVVCWRWRVYAGSEEQCGAVPSVSMMLLVLVGVVVLLCINQQL